MTTKHGLFLFRGFFFFFQNPADKRTAAGVGPGKCYSSKPIVPRSTPFILPLDHLALLTLLVEEDKCQ